MSKDARKWRFAHGPDANNAVAPGCEQAPEMRPIRRCSFVGGPEDITSIRVVPLKGAQIHLGNGDKLRRRTGSRHSGATTGEPMLPLLLSARARFRIDSTHAPSPRGPSQKSNCTPTFAKRPRITACGRSHDAYALLTPVTASTFRAL